MNDLVAGTLLILKITKHKCTMKNMSIISFSMGRTVNISIREGRAYFYLFYFKNYSFDQKKYLGLWKQEEPTQYGKQNLISAYTLLAGPCWGEDRQAGGEVDKQVDRQMDRSIICRQTAG